jgi:AraC-like DNA-binding protein
MSTYFKGVLIDNPNLTLQSSANVPYGELIDISHHADQASEADYFKGNGIKVHDLYLPNFAMRISEGTLAYDAWAVNQKGIGSTIPSSCLFFDGNFMSQRKGQSKAKVNHKGEQNFIFDPNTEEIVICKADQSYHSVHISIAPEYFDHFLPDDERWANDLKTRMIKQEHIKGEVNALITLQQKQAIDSVISCSVEGKLGWHIREAFLMQVVMLQLHMLFQKQGSAEQPKIRKRDAQLMQEIKNYLDNTFTDEHSLTSLSVYFGINQHKLTTMFKLLFGVSVFDYIALLKMNYAKQLLEKEGMLVNEVASIIGYKNPHHFGSAFKKKFGINPSRLRG